MNFGEAIELIKKDETAKVSRSGWNGKNMWLALARPIPCESTKGISSYINGQEPYPTLPFIVMKTATNELVPWLASQTDILAEDWGQVNG